MTILFQNVSEFLKGFSQNSKMGWAKKQAGSSRIMERAFPKALFTSTTRYHDLCIPSVSSRTPL